MAEAKEKKSNPLFDILNIIESTKDPWESLDEGLKKGYSQFMINRFISSKDFYVPILSIITLYPNMTNEMHYTLLCNFVHRQKHYFGYKAYKTSKDIDDLALYAVMHEWNLGKKDATYYYENLSDKEIKYLKSKWKDHYELYK